MNRSLLLLARLAAPLAAALSPALALADAPAAASAQTVIVPAAAGQDALVVKIGSGGIAARACPGSCAASAETSPVDGVPAEVLPALSSAKAATITLDGGRRVVRVDAEIASKEGPSGSWTMLLAAPLTSAKSAAPVALWSGHTGRSRGNEGEEAVSVVRVEPLAKGASRIVIGELRADLTICGRPAIVSAREVDPSSLALSKSAMVDNLSADEKKGAEKVIAAREAGAGAQPTIRLLRATSASSALEKKIVTLTDGSVETGWTEAKIGDGHGEWVRMSASSDVGITGLGVSIRPTGVEVPDGASPKTLYIATDDRLYEVQIPETAWNDPEARYEVKLPAEVKTSCLAVVLGDAHAPKTLINPRVTIAEVTARTALDGATYDALAASLAGGGDEARAAAAMLGKGDARSVAAITAAWDKLDDAGKALAMEVADAAACGDQAPFYAGLLSRASGDKKRLSGSSADPLVTHARDRLRRCGRASAPALARLVQEGADPVRVAAAEELALVSPPDAIAAILAAAPSVADAVRRDLRAALARAAQSPKARESLADWMLPERFGALGDVAKIDLLRAMGPSLPGVEGGKKALMGLVGKDAPFRTRFLLLAPAAELAKKGDADALAFLREGLAKDADPHVRARAAEVAGKVAALAPDLVTAAGDAEVRVREAAVRALSVSAGEGTKLPAGAEPVIVKTLAKDEWTFMRTAAADALSAMPKSGSVDKALAAALADASADVRGRALDGLGAHRSIVYAGKVREQAKKVDEVPDVRARALLALGAMCDKDSLDLLTDLALGAKSLTSEIERRLGAAAISALGDIHPADLAARLAPLAAKDSSPLVREMVKAALAATSTCDRS